MASASRLRRVRVARGVSIDYAEQGDRTGAPVLLLHGLGDSLRSWEPVLARLPHDLRALTPSFRGHGESDRPHHGYGPADHVGDVAALLDDAGAGEAVVAGHSSGSQVAQLFALTHPRRTRGLVLVGAPGPHPARAAAAGMTAEVAALADPVDETRLRGFAEGTVAGPVPGAFLEAVVAEARKVPARVYQAAWPGIRDFDVSRALRRITAPTLVIWGDQDRVPVATPESQDQLLDAIPDARLVVYPGAGHSPHWEHPARFASDLASFVRGLAA